MPEKPMRVCALIKAKDILREDVVAAIATVFDGKSTLALGEGGHALILPDLAKMTPFAREAILSTLIEAGAVKG